MLGFLTLFKCKGSRRKMEEKAEVWIPGSVGSPEGREDSHRETGGRLREEPELPLG